MIDSLIEIGKFVLAIIGMLAAAVIVGMMIDAFIPFDKK